MRKIVLKTFVYSFAFSLLVIFSINKLQAYSPLKNNKQSSVKVSKNIISFLKEESKEVSNPLLESIPSENTNIENFSSTSEEIIQIAKSDDIDINFYNDTNVDETYPLDAEQFSLEELAINSYSDIDDNEVIAIDLNIDSIDTPLLDNNIEESSKHIESNDTNSNKWQVTGFDNSVMNNIQPSDNIAESSNMASDGTFTNSLIPIQRNKNAGIALETEILSSAPKDEVAMSKSNISAKSIATASSNVSDVNINDNPWVVAKGAKFPNNSMALEDYNSDKESAQVSGILDSSPKTKDGEVKVAEMVRNILIPIPEDILKEGNLTPQLISSKRNKDLQDKIERQIAKDKVAISEDIKQIEKEEKDTDDSETVEKKDKKTIFDSISSIFSSGKTPTVGVSKSGDHKFDSMESVYTVKKTGKNKKDNKVTKILPTEIKLSFQPNRAEISGQTLKWIEAFANKTIEDGSVALEVRIDGTSSFELQQKRLGMLHNILISKGVNYNKINIVFTTREPNSFIIRTVRIDEKSVAMDNQKVNRNSKNYQNW